MKSSPTRSNKRFEAFTWKTFPEMIHEGMPLEYDFDWVKVPLDYEKSIKREIVQNLQEE